MAVSYAFKAELITIEKHRASNRRAIFSSSEVRNEKKSPCTSEEPSYLLMFYLFSSLFIFKAKGTNMSKKNDPLCHFILSFCFCKQPLPDRLHSPCSCWKTTVGQTCN